MDFTHQIRTDLKYQPSVVHENSIDYFVFYRLSLPSSSTIEDLTGEVFSGDPHTTVDLQIHITMKSVRLPNSPLVRV